MATEEVLQDDLSASDQTVTDPSDTPNSEGALNEETVKSHPLYKEIEQKYAAAEQEIKTQKGRLKKVDTEKVDPAKQSETVTMTDIKTLEWKLENKERIAVVKDEYEEILANGYQGEKVSAIVALELAEKQAKVDTTGTRRQRSDDISVSSTTLRNNEGETYLSETDKQLGLTKKEKLELEKRHPHLKGE